MIEDMQVKQQNGTPATPVLQEDKTQAPKEKKIDDTPLLDEHKPIEIPQEDWQVSPLFYEVANYFSIDPKDYQKSADKLSLITEWAIQRANSNKMHDILPVIRQLEDRIMKPMWGETRYGNIYRYLRLSIKKEAFEKALGAFEKLPPKK